MRRTNLGKTHFSIQFNLIQFNKLYLHGTSAVRVAITETTQTV
jgi:hypothetical protein